MRTGTGKLFDIKAISIPICVSADIPTERLNASERVAVGGGMGAEVQFKCDRRKVT
jgi:hypothetical protein